LLDTVLSAEFRLPTRQKPRGSCHSLLTCGLRKPHCQCRKTIQSTENSILFWTLPESRPSHIATDAGRLRLAAPRAPHTPQPFRTFRRLPEQQKPTRHHQYKLALQIGTPHTKNHITQRTEKPTQQQAKQRSDIRHPRDGRGDVRAGDSPYGGAAAPAGRARRRRRRGRRQRQQDGRRRHAHLRPRRARHGGHPGRREGAARRVRVRGGHAGAGHGRHPGAGGGRAGAGGQRRAAPGGARGRRQVPAHGAADGQVHAQVRAAGQRRRRQGRRRVQGRRAHGDRREAAPAGAQEAQDHRGQGRLREQAVAVLLKLCVFVFASFFGITNHPI
jgi:hypothetical protein